jgi:hypothetical protein
MFMRRDAADAVNKGLANCQKLIAQAKEGEALPSARAPELSSSSEQRTKRRRSSRLPRKRA